MPNDAFDALYSKLYCTVATALGYRGDETTPFPNMQRAITSPGRAVCLVDFLFSGCTKMLFSPDSLPFFIFFSKRQPLLHAVTQTLWLRNDKKRS